jgi:undecaprenyl-diphosphatase
LEASELSASGFLNALPDGWLIGALTAFVSGLISLVILKRLITGEKWWVFSVYCMTIGCAAVIYSLMGA